MKTAKLWIAIAVVLLIAAIVFLSKGNAGKQAPAAASAPAALEFLPSDIVQIQARDLRQTLRLSGSLRAVQQAVVKARLSGEVQEVRVREGEAVQKGQVLVTMNASEYQARVAQAKGALLAARGQLDIAAKARDNNRALVEKGFISKNAFDNANSQYDIAQANVSSAKGALDVAQEALKDAVIRAPIAGLVSSRTVEPGEKVSPDSRLLEIVDLRQLELEAAVPAAEVVHIAPGQEVQVKVEGIPDLLSGKLARINPTTQAGSRSIPVYIQIDNPQSLLRAGMFGEALLTLQKKSGVLTIPQSAVQRVDGQAYVYAIENGKLVQQPVVLGMSGRDESGNAVEVVSGLQSGAQVVKTNLGTLRAGTPVKFAQVTAPSTPAASPDR